ncbi:hypothetical protein CDAR_183451 [Caerostris darwini]|uniref:Uncharacterized protein n=1 Tax=Caerostris darwini TaxID=1538125 RepID=A0AAV4MUR5_9ARAC|nr:hypothetical protein CDAR_183451 [Caerostris darwini]
MRKGRSDSFSEGNQLLGVSFFFCHFGSRSREMSLGDVYVNDGLGQELNEEENFISEKFLFVKVLFFIGSAVPVKYGGHVFWVYLGQLEMSLLMDGCEGMWFGLKQLKGMLREQFE